jgi:hypothetical protein
MVAGQVQRVIESAGGHVLYLVVLGFHGIIVVGPRDLSHEAILWSAHSPGKIEVLQGWKVVEPLPSLA